MTHPLITRLTDELGWPFLADLEAVSEFVKQPGWHVLFVPGNPARNLETADVAVILPELVMTFQGVFDCAVISDAIETELREQTRVFKTPSLIFYFNGEFAGGIPKVRDWAEYIERIKQIMAKPAVAAE